MTLVEKKRSKIVDPSSLSRLSFELKKEGLMIATLNGSFDLFHAGHLYILSEAAKQADVLIVLLNSDASIKAYKGKNRPIISLKDRLKLIAALEGVDYVSSFEETTPINVLSKIQPHVHVNGIEYGQNCVEAEVVKKHGGVVHLVRRVEGLSTSELIKKIKLL